MLGFKSLRENFKHIYTLDYFKIRFLSYIKKIEIMDLFFIIYEFHITCILFLTICEFFFFFYINNLKVGGDSEFGRPCPQLFEILI